MFNETDPNYRTAHKQTKIETIEKYKSNNSFIQRRPWNGFKMGKMTPKTFQETLSQKRVPEKHPKVFQTTATNQQHSESKNTNSFAFFLFAKNMFSPNLFFLFCCSPWGVPDLESCHNIISESENEGRPFSK